MPNKKQYAVKIPGLLRLSLAALLILSQLAVATIGAINLREYYFYVYFSLQIISLITALFVVRNDRNPTYSLTWIIILLSLPVFGLIVYLLWGRNAKFRKSQNLLNAVNQRIQPLIEPNPEALAALKERIPERHLQANYLANQGFPIYQNTICEYCETGEKQFEQLFIDLEQAEKFIFLEFFILADGIIWDRVEELLIRKAEAGLDVRLMFDDYGSVIKAPNNLIAHLRSHRVSVINFNPVLRYVSRLYVNYRNHQKICVIDGNIGYTGGTNLADEYANLHTRFGYWKDTAIRIEGDAVWGLTTTFLMMWEMQSGTIEDDYSLFEPTYSPRSSSFYVPYWDGPVNNPNNPAEDIYLSMINTAANYLYISTPYFVVDDRMEQDICRAANSGVDVRLVTPGIPDKWYVHLVTQSHYRRLLRAGVKIYEYTPGFIHAKTMIADDNHLITGSVNLDFRSFNLLYENAIWICDDPVIQDIYHDFEDIFEVSQLIDLDTWNKRPLWKKIMQSFLKIFAPLF